MHMCTPSASELDGGTFQSIRTGHASGVGLRNWREKNNEAMRRRTKLALRSSWTSSDISKRRTSISTLLSLLKRLTCRQRPVNSPKW